MGNQRHSAGEENFASYQTVAIERGICNNEGNPTLEFLVQPQDFQFVKLVDFVPGAMPPSPLDFEEIARKYAELESRTTKKLVNAFVEIDLRKGQGVESQIVFRGKICDGTYYTWSLRAVRKNWNWRDSYRYRVSVLPDKLIIIKLKINSNTFRFLVKL